MFRVVPDSFPDLRDRPRQCIVGNKCSGPYRLENLVLGNDPAWILDQELKHSKGLWFESATFAIDRNPKIQEIDIDISKPITIPC